MKKSSRRTGSRRKAGAAAARKAPAHVTSSGTAFTRRRLLRGIRNGAIAAAVLSVGGWVLADSYRGHVERHDLSVIGNGVPVVVQIHDPQCATCRALQSETLSAAKSFSDAQLVVRVADIRSSEGRALASRYGVPHVTLLLFDGDGEMQQVISGLVDRAVLREAFEAHVSRFPGGRSGGA